jgi:hypothetical protein
MLGQDNSPTIEPWVSERSCNQQNPVRILPPQAWGIIGSQCSLQRSLRVWRNCNQFRQVQPKYSCLEAKTPISLLLRVKLAPYRTAPR